ncbi:MAG TPA: DnaJ C-terminal domain-containing protein [Gaiellales bacterium]|jgi:curved DNA-binding protein|nr:DnaJ C-terminal domain-containing protein [Gaiellales bacterium]
MPPVAFRDYYESLGVARDASDDEIRRAYRKLARTHHPDVNKEEGSEDRFKEVSEAYEVLHDPEKRARYDRLGANWRSGQDVSGAPGFDQSGGFEGFGGFGGGDDFGGTRFDFGGGDDFSDFFSSLFGGPRGRTRASSNGSAGFSLRGGDQEAVLDLSLEEVASGGKRRISLADGRSFEVAIPRGVRDGQRIRLAGEGGRGAGGGAAGDLYLRVRIAPHPHFRVEGRDLHTDLPITPWEAALGATVDVRTLTGTARVRVPAGSSSDRRLRLRGEGLPGAQGRRGDLYAMVKIRVPRKLTETERELFEQLAAESHFDPRRRR